MNKKELKQNYKQTLPPMGVYQIRNLSNEKVFVGSSLNLNGIKNRYLFALKMNSHPNKNLQAEWNSFGEENFIFEILEEIEPRTGLDYKKELEFMEDLWLEQLQPFGEKGYNEKKKTLEEKLRMIGEKRKID